MRERALGGTGRTGGYGRATLLGYQPAPLQWIRATADAADPSSRRAVRKLIARHCEPLASSRGSRMHLWSCAGVSGGFDMGEPYRALRVESSSTASGRNLWGPGRCRITHRLGRIRRRRGLRRCPRLSGQGGNDPQSKRQVADQELTRGNAGLLRSQLDGREVRVIRGSGGDPAYSPTSGFRYDGLYRVSDSWQDLGHDGYRIWRFRLEKVDANYIHGFACQAYDPGRTVRRRCSHTSPRQPA